MIKNKKVLYFAGPGDVIGTLRQWQGNKDDDTQVANTYSGQFFNACAKSRLSGHAVAIRQDVQILDLDDISAEHMKKPLRKNTGLFFHLNQFLMGVIITFKALRTSAKIVVISGTTCRWFSLFLLGLMGKKIIPSIHCVIYPDIARRSRLKCLLDSLDKLFFKLFVKDMMVVSSIVGNQVKALYGTHDAAIKVFRPTYQKEQFIHFSPKEMEYNTPFVLLYVGRIEVNKGVFDMIAMMSKLQSTHTGAFKMHMCGSGSADKQLRQAIVNNYLDDVVTFHGHCNKQEMQGFYQQCHTVVVPTRSDFVEGFNKVVVEAVLSYRPVITSKVCPALFAVPDAALEAEPDSMDSYFKQVLRLAKSPTLYQDKANACKKYRMLFFDLANGWEKTLENIMHSG